MDPKLMIDDDYFSTVGDYCVRRGSELQNILISYLDILNKINSSALSEGEIADTLHAYIERVDRLKYHLEIISKNIQNNCRSFLDEVDAAEDFQF